MALRAARAAAELLQERFRRPATGVVSKSSGTDLATDADRDAEAVIVRTIAAARPDDAIVAEEGGGADGASGVRWLVDPLDGTINFVWGVPQWSVSIAALDGRGPVAAVVIDPSRGELFTARRGAGAHLDGAPLRMPPAPPLGEALVATGFNYRADERVRQAERLAHVLPRVRDVRRFGSAAIDLAWLAAGRLDGYFETGVNPWDWAAGSLLVTEAGGVVQELPARGGSPAGVLAAAPGLAGTLRALVDASYR